MPDVLESPPAPAKVLFKPITGRPWERAQTMREQGATWPEIVASTGIPNKTLRQRAREEHWSDRMVPVVIPKIAPLIASKSDELRSTVIDASLAAARRIVQRPEPVTTKQEAAHVDMLRTLTAQAAQACGWAEQDRLVGGVLAGQVERFTDIITEPKREPAPPEPGPTVDVVTQTSRKPGE